MKNLKNVKTEIDSADEAGVKIKFADLARACVNNLPQTGLDVVQMSARLALMKKIDKGGEELKLEDAEAETLKKCATEMRWLFMSDDVVKFLAAVEKL